MGADNSIDMKSAIDEAIRTGRPVTIYRDDGTPRLVISIPSAELPCPCCGTEVEQLRAKLATVNADILTQARDWYGKVEAVEAERDQLRDGLRWALAELNDEAWPYAGDYFEEKHRDVARENELRAVVGLEPIATKETP